MSAVTVAPEVVERQISDCSNRLRMFCSLHNVRLSLRGEDGAKSSIDRITDTLLQLRGHFALCCVAAAPVTPAKEMRHILSVYGVDVYSK